MYWQPVIISLFATNFAPLLAKQQNAGFCHSQSWPSFLKSGKSNHLHTVSGAGGPTSAATTSSRQSDRSLAFEWLARRWRHGRQRPPCTKLRVHITVFTGSTEASNHVCCHGRPCSLCPAPCVTEHRNGIQRQCG